VRSHKVTQRIMSGAEVLETVEWAGRYIPIIPVYGSEVNLKGKRHFRSMIRGAKDAQRMRNYWRTTTTEMVALPAPKRRGSARRAFETDAQKWATANTQPMPTSSTTAKSRPSASRSRHSRPARMQEALNAGDDIKAIVGIYDSSLGARSNETSRATAINARDRRPTPARSTSSTTCPARSVTPAG
jgi:hypothetical protein